MLKSNVAIAMSRKKQSVKFTKDEDGLEANNINASQSIPDINMKPNGGQIDKLKQSPS